MTAASGLGCSRVVTSWCQAVHGADAEKNWTFLDLEESPPGPAKLHAHPVNASLEVRGGGGEKKNSNALMYACVYSWLKAEFHRGFAWSARAQEKGGEPMGRQLPAQLSITLCLRS